MKFLITGWLALVATVVCSEDGEASLFAQISALDDQLFLAVNACELDRVGPMFAADLEFYHDTGGLDGKEKTMNNIGNLCAQENRLTRTLVPDSVEVYPVPGFGAIQKGRHTFCHLEDGKQDCGTFEFVHLWRETPTHWEIARVLSYGH